MSGVTGYASSMPSPRRGGGSARRTVNGCGRSFLPPCTPIRTATAARRLDPREWRRPAWAGNGDGRWGPSAERDAHGAPAAWPAPRWVCGLQLERQHVGRVRGDGEAGVAGSGRGDVPVAGGHPDALVLDRAGDDVGDLGMVVVVGCAGVAGGRFDQHE